MLVAEKSKDSHVLDYIVPSPISGMSPRKWTIACETASDEFVHAVSDGIARGFEKSQNKNSNTKNPDQDSQQIAADHEKLTHKVYKFLAFVRGYTHISASELTHTIYLIWWMIEHDMKIEADKPGGGIVAVSNMGTILLCAVVISMKMLRDAPYRNTWWAKAFGLGIDVLNDSEQVFLERISYEPFLCEELYWKIFDTLYEQSLIEEGIKQQIGLTSEEIEVQCQISMGRMKDSFIAVVEECIQTSLIKHNQIEAEKQSSFETEGRDALYQYNEVNYGVATVIMKKPNPRENMTNQPTNIYA
ncbi:MAG: hypothetical protein EZS28_049717 [Streblomastix strix]|uniref:Uncharacterized protein n=1 Tax=Streblomastix strix TaxID=222440 RepID=A0A5J4T8K2_9EUKA|nr:MAG: hypothetical protein EZS28_049717 [Streblomastix strix]